MGALWPKTSKVASSFFIAARAHCEKRPAQRTLTVIIFLLAVLLAGISYLVKTYGIAATDPGLPGYQSVLSMLTAAVFGKGLFYYLSSTPECRYPLLHDSITQLPMTG
jgi:hypothetical protein